MKPGVNGENETKCMQYFAKKLGEKVGARLLDTPVFITW